MKYRHFFTLISEGDSYRVYKADDITVRLDFFKSMYRVAVLRDEEPLMPTYSVCPGDSVINREGRDKLSTEGFETVTPAVKETDTHVTIGYKDYKLTIEKLNFRMELSSYKGVLFKDREYISYNFSHELGKGSMHFLSREDDEKIFGLGDKSGDVNKNGLSFRLSTSDAMGFDARSSDPLYKHVPFYICENSVGSYGIYYDTYSNGAFDFGREKNNYYDIFKSFKCDEENLVFYVLLGTVPEITRNFSFLTGKMFMPPKWSFKYCGSTMAYTDADNADEQLRNFVSLCNKYELSPGGFYLSSGYTQIGDKRCVFHWNTEKIPSPEGLASYFKENGVEFLPNVKPAFLTDHPWYKELAEKGFFLHYEDGSPALFPFWSGMGSYLDFTNPEAYDFWRDSVKSALVDKGYKNIWNDNNEYDICDESVYAAGFGHPVKAYLIRPLFSLLMTMASLEAQDKTVRHYSVSRSGIPGLSRIAATWTGDNRTSFDDFRYNHKMAMTMSMSGFYNFGQDIGGFAGPCPDEELFIRWIQYGIFTPRFTLHSWNPDGSSTMPWLYPKLIPTVKRLFDLRESFVAYLYNETYRSVLTHDPIIYPVFFKFPEYDCESDLFFFGDSILACPVFDKGVDSITVRLPKNNGGWYFDGKRYEGENVMPAALTGLPVWFHKGGSIFATDEDGILDFEVFTLDEGEFEYTYLNDDGVSNFDEANPPVIKLKVICEKEKIYVLYSTDTCPLLHVVDSRKRFVETRHWEL